MEKDFCALTFSEKERNCESVFVVNGPYWHLYTDGTEMQNIFCSDEEFNTGMWILASAICQTREIEVITFEIMNNHIHLILSGCRNSCLDMFDIFKRRLKKTMQHFGRVIDWKKFKAEILPIESIRALRNEIIYVNRNAYVANPRYTPVSYPWGGGCAYFNEWAHLLRPVKYKDLSIDKRRELIHSKDITSCSRLQIIGNRVYIPSFCNIQLGESLFADPRVYFNSLSRNAEAFSQIAERLKDSIFLTDGELFSITIAHISQKYNIQNTAHLSPQQKIECARFLHLKYKATKQQIRRLLRLEEKIIQELLP